MESLILAPASCLGFRSSLKAGRLLGLLFSSPLGLLHMTFCFGAQAPMPSSNN